MGARDLVVFLGPSLAASRARALAPCTVLGPAAQGDVWRALALRPRAMVLVDGVFESVPSVWHHEILDALDAGVAVFGAGSMGALRAAELWRHGMVGVGTVFRWVRDGVVEDDSEVALLHAGPDHGYQAFTVPLVNVRHDLARAVGAGVLSRREERVALEAAASVFWQDRSPGSLERALRRRLGSRASPRFELWRRDHPEDVKALDARQCILEAARWVKAGVPLAPRPVRLPSSLVRRRRLAQTAEPPVQEEIALLAAWARQLGLRPPQEEVRRQRKRLRGMSADLAARRAEDLALAELVLEQGRRMVADGPGPDETRHGRWRSGASE